MRAIRLSAVLGLCACSSPPGLATDAGADAGGGSDAGSPSDAGSTADSGSTFDAGSTSDSGTRDAGARPVGIYVLDSAKGADGGNNRDANLRGYPFVAGYAWRKNWADFETAQGVYDFSSLDIVVGEVQALHQKMTLEFGETFGLVAPAYVAVHAGVTTYSYGNKAGTQTSAVPWDPFLQARFAAMVQALASHPVYDAVSGTMVALRDHPVLANVHLGVGGLGAIRDSYGDRMLAISGITGYSRANLLAAVEQSLALATANFPNQFVFVGFWPISDGNNTPALWQDVAMHLSGVGYFQENLAASAAGGVVTGYPGTTEAAPLYDARNQTFILFQALEGWTIPFADPSKTDGGTPYDGLEYALTTFNCSYVELYADDIDNTAYWPSYAQWNTEVGGP